MSSAKVIGESARAVEHRTVRLPDLREAGDIPTTIFRDLPPTYIPVRNAIFYSFAASYAEECGASVVVGGHNRDDLEVFEDVSPGFFRRLQEAVVTGSPLLRRRGFRISRPLKQKTKVEVLKLASSMGVPLQLTWSCHRDGETHCWDCPGCESRVIAFMRAGMSDPLSSMPRKVT